MDCNYFLPINCENFELIDYNYIGLNRINKKGGGVGMYISKQIQYKIRKDLNENIDDSIETIFLEINQTIGKNIIIGVIYRPPNNKIELFENAIDNILSKIGKENKICYLMGDFNIDLLKSESCDYTNRLIEQLFTSSFLPLITKPTRITAHTATLIDNIFTNNTEKLNNSCINGIIYADISDHLPIVHVFNPTNYRINSNLSANNSKYKRIFSDKNNKSFINSIKNTSWENITTNLDNPNDAFNDFSKLFTEAYEKNFPQKIIKNYINKEKSPWMTNCILKSVRKKNKLYKTFLKSSNRKNETLYKRYKNRDILLLESGFEPGLEPGLDQKNAKIRGIAITQ